MEEEEFDFREVIIIILLLLVIVILFFMCTLYHYLMVHFFSFKRWLATERRYLEKLLVIVDKYLNVFHEKNLKKGHLKVSLIITKRIMRKITNMSKITTLF